MSEYLLNQIYVEMSKYQTNHPDPLHQHQVYFLYQYDEKNKPSLWDTTLFNTGSLLVSLGERLKRNKEDMRLSEDCR